MAQVGGSVYFFAADYGAHNIKRYDVSAVYSSSWGVSGNAAGQLNGPVSVAADKPDTLPAGYIYVVCASQNKVHKFTPAGVHALTFGGTGTADGKMDMPWGAAVDSRGFVYVADTLNHRIQKFDSEGNYLGKWGTEGTGNGQFNSPGQIAIDGDTIYVVDTWNNRIQYFSY